MAIDEIGFVKIISYAHTKYMLGQFGNAIINRNVARTHRFLRFFEAAAKTVTG